MTSHMARIHQWMLIILVMALTTAAFRSQGTTDLNTWIGWANHTGEIGLIHGYAMHRNYYPPLTITLLGLCQQVAEWLNVEVVYPIKGSLLVFLMAVTLVFYQHSGKRFVLTLIFYGAMLTSSLGLAYLDIYMALPLLLSIMCLKKNQPALFALFFSVACLVKYQPLIIAPFFAFYLAIKHINKPFLTTSLQQFFIKIVVPGLMPWIVAFTIFGGALLLSLLGLSDGNWLSAQALNFNWILTRHLLQTGLAEAYAPGLDPQIAMINTIPSHVSLWVNRLAWGIYLSTLLALIVDKKNLEKLLLYSLLGSMSWFMFHTGAHENHLFLASILAISLFCINDKYLYLALGVLFMSTLNMFLFYGFSGAPVSGLQFHWQMNCQEYCYWLDPYLLIASVNVIYFLILWCTVLGSAWLSHRKSRWPTKP